MHANTTSAKAPTLSAAPLVQPLSEEQRRRHDDARWARHDAEVARRYRGEFVVPFRQQIVAHGTAVADVLAEAARVTGCRCEELPVCFIDDPLQEIPR